MGTIEATLEAVEEEVFRCQGMVECGLSANHTIIMEFSQDLKVDGMSFEDIVFTLNDEINFLQGQFFIFKTKSLSTHYFGRLGWLKPEGAHILLIGEKKVKFSPVVVYNHELEHYIKNLQMDLLSELFENDALRESLKTEKLKVANVKKHDLEIQKLREDLKNSQAMAHVGDVEIQKLKNQLLELQGRHRKLRVNREYMAEELEKIKPDQKKPTDDEDMICPRLVVVAPP
ncbi:40S ribosomal protein S5-1 [Hordeum vulgare]|nr:40S ribosomal protein S5-1 [Hordeum vulgare]